MRKAVPLDKCYRILNHGPTVLVSSAHGNTKNIMAAAWSMPLDYSPPKVAVVIEAGSFTRELVDGHWVQGPRELNTLHYVAGGHFFVASEMLEANERRGKT